MHSSLLKKVAFSCAAALLALCAGGWTPAWGGSILEAPGLVDSSISIADDTGGLVGNTVTVGAPGVITSTGISPAIYTVTSGYTLKTGANFIAINGSSVEAAGILNAGGTVEIDPSGTVALQSLHASMDNSSGTVTNNGTILASAGSIRNNDGAAMHNNNFIVVTGTGSINHAASTGGARLVNTGTIIFGDTTSRYQASGHAGTVNNAGGAIQISLDHGDLADLLGDLNTSDAGTINFINGDAGAAGFTNTDFAHGTFRFSATQTTTYTGAIDVGYADVLFANGGTFGADVTAATITVQGSPSTFNPNVRANGNLIIAADTSYDAAFSMHNITVSNNSTLTLGSSANVTISSGNRMGLALYSDKVILASGAQLTFARGSRFDGYGIIDNSANAAAAGVRVAGDVRDSSLNNALNNVLDALVRGGGGDIGNVVITGDLPQSPINNNSVAAGRLTIEGTQGTAAAPHSTVIDSWDATLVLAGGGHFSNYVSSDTAIEIKGNSVFYSSFGWISSTPVSVDAGVTAEFTRTAIYAAGTATVDGTVKADAGMGTAATLFGRTNLGVAGEFRLNASQDETLTADFMPGTNASGSRVVLSANAPGRTVTMGGVVYADSADLTIESGVYRFTKTGSPTILSANTFALGAGATLEYITGANDVGRVYSAGGLSAIAGNLVVGAGDTLAFTGLIRFANGSSITLDPGATVTANAFDFSALSANGLALTLNGDQSAWLNKLLFDDVTDNGVFYTGRYQTAVNGTRLEITGYTASVSKILGGLVMDDMSVNLANGFNLLDDIDADGLVKQKLKDALNNDTAVIEGWLSSPASYGRGLRAQRQRQGEYGNVAQVSLSTTTALFGRGLARRLDTNVDMHFGLNSFFSASARGGDSAYASLSGKQVRSRNGGYDYCPAATTVWADFHGGWAEQKAKSNINGYEYDGYGVSVGAERRIDRFLVGVAGGYTRAGVDVDDLSTDYDADVMNLGVYAGYIHESGFFARAGLGFAQAWNDYDVAMAMGPNKKGDFDSQAYTANLDLGYVIRTCAVNVVPSVGLHYTHIRQDGWRETGGRQGTVGFFEKEHYNAVDVPVALRVNRVFDTGTVKIAPEARAAWVYAAKRNRSEINYGLQGANAVATMYGVNPGRSRFQVGAGVKAQWGGRYEAGLDYDYEFRSKYHNHNLSVNLGVSF